MMGSVEPSKLFTLGVALSLYSGAPVTITTGGDENGDGITNDRPAGVPRNSMHGPGFAGLDISLSHDFHFFKSKKETPVLSASIDSFNALNHTNDETYIGTITSPFFGRAVSAQPPRRMQLNLEFKF